MSETPPGRTAAAAARLNAHVHDNGDVEPASLAGMRRDYQGPLASAPLTEESLASTWLEQFQRWLSEAVASPEIVEPNAMIVATAAPTGEPSARTVLLKGVDERGFVFFTNYGSRKASEAAANPWASLVLPWHPISRQVIVCGPVERVERTETEAYFATRPRESQLGAWASPQSQVVTRDVLDATMAQLRARYPEGVPVPAPPHWGGLLVRPETVEFWQGRSGRLHDRIRYRRRLAEPVRDDSRRRLAEPVGDDSRRLGEPDHGDWLVERLAP